MTKYEFQWTLYRNAREMCEGIAGDFLSAGGLNSRSDMLGFLAESTDQQLAAELISMHGVDWDEWLSENDASREMIVDAFSSIRANFDEIFPVEA